LCSSYRGESEGIRRYVFHNPSSCSRVIKEAVEKENWEDVGVISKTKPTKNRPGTYYKVYETEVTLYGKKYRAVVAHSSSHDNQKQKSIKKDLIKFRNELEEILKIEKKKEYYCEADAQVEAKKLMDIKSDYYRLELNVEEKVKYGRGRPDKDGKRQVKEIKYSLNGKIVEKTDTLNRKKDEAGCYVLLSNLPKEGEYCHTSEKILRGYKEQYGIEQNFGFLKEPIIVNDLFLKKPERVEALGLVMLISLLIWRLIERSMRQYVKNTGKKLSGWDNKPTDRPTSFMMTGKFQGLLIIKIAERRKLCRPLEPAQLEFLCALGIEPDIFTVTSKA